MPDKLISTVACLSDELRLTLPRILGTDEADDDITLVLVVMTLVSPGVIQEQNAVVVLEIGVPFPSIERSHLAFLFHLASTCNNTYG